jgi:hypothetical protein
MPGFSTVSLRIVEETPRWISASTVAEPAEEAGDARGRPVAQPHDA